VRYLRRAILAVLLLATLVLAACGSSVTNGGNPIKASGVLRVGTEGVYSPFSYHDPATGQLVGYDVDVARAVADKLGLKSNSSRPHGIRSSPRSRPTGSTWSPTR
jgi:cystine transport system permease protein